VDVEWLGALPDNTVSLTLSHRQAKKYNHIQQQVGCN
jgi:hypothetical protein